MPDRLFALSGGWRHIAGTLNAANSGEPTLGASATTAFANYFSIPAYDYFDLQASFAIARNLELRFTANNLFNRRPPILPDASNYVGLVQPIPSPAITTCWGANCRSASPPGF